MPIFEYCCKKCGKTIEKIQRKPLAEVSCPDCGDPALRTVSLTAMAAADAAGCSTPAGSGFT